MKHKLSILIYIKIIIPVSYLFEQRNCILIAFLG